MNFLHICDLDQICYLVMILDETRNLGAASRCECTRYTNLIIYRSGGRKLQSAGLWLTVTDRTHQDDLSGKIMDRNGRGRATLFDGDMRQLLSYLDWAG